MVEIKPYAALYEAKFFQFLRQQGPEWSCYYDEKHKDNYRLCLQKSIAYVLFFNNQIIGYIRAIEDPHFYIYICDLLVDIEHRGHGYGKMLMTYIQSLYPLMDTFVMSDVDPYYIKQGYEREGSIFLLPKLENEVIK